MPFDAGPTPHRQLARRIDLAVGGHGRRGFEIGHERQAPRPFDAEPVDRVVAVVGRTALALQQRPVHRRRARQRLRRRIEEHHGAAKHPGQGRGDRRLQVDRDIAAAIPCATGREDMQGLPAAEGLDGVDLDDRPGLERGFTPGRAGQLIRGVGFEIVAEERAVPIGGVRKPGRQACDPQRPGPAPFARKWGLSPFHGWATQMMR
jgi:hypothetical protein